MDVVNAKRTLSSYYKLDQVLAFTTFAGLDVHDIRTNIFIFRLETANELMVEEHFELTFRLVGLPIEQDSIISFLQNDWPFDKLNCAIEDSVLRVQTVRKRRARSKSDRCEELLDWMIEGFGFGHFNRLEVDKNGGVLIGLLVVVNRR